MEELTDHIGHVGWKDQQEQTQRHRSEVLPQTPEGQTEEGAKEMMISSICSNMGILLTHSHVTGTTVVSQNSACLLM